MQGLGRLKWFQSRAQEVYRVIPFKSLAENCSVRNLEAGEKAAGRKEEEQSWELTKDWE